jgi:hypothetical protein
MIFFNHDMTEEKMKNLLKAAQQDFRFDQDTVKNRLMPVLDRIEILPYRRTLLTAKSLAYSMSGAVFVVFVSGTFAFASTSKPGDKLFVVNKWRENIILHLPLSVDQKTRFETGIVNNRLRALQTVNVQMPQAQENKKLDTIKESDESLHNAIELVSANKHSLEAEGQTEQAEKMDQALTQLDNLAQQHEQQIQIIEASTEDGTNREIIKQHLHQIYTTRAKAHEELHLQMEIESDGN